LQQKIHIINKVSFSYYEVYTNAQRAFSGLGFPHGADEDAAYVITWLELHKLKGIDLFCSIIKKLNKQYDCKINLLDVDKKIDLLNKSILITGPSIIDYLVSKFILSNQDQYSLINYQDPIFFIPLLSKLIKKRIYTKIINKKETLCLINNENILINNSLFNNDMNDEIKIIFSNNPNNNEILDININLKDAKKNLSIGLNPDQKNWDKVSNLAFQTFVPESKESRSKGAGGGDAND